MSILNRCQELKLPATEFIVVGSGILDVLGIRKANDLDILVEQPAFAELSQRDFVQRTKNEEPYLEGDDIEAWLSFDDMSFSELITQAVQIEGYYFTPLGLIKDWKARMGRPKDLADLKLIEAYLRKNT